MCYPLKIKTIINITIIIIIIIKRPLKKKIQNWLS